MLRAISLKQLVEWEQYAALEPFGELRADYRNAKLLQQHYNSNARPEHRITDLKRFLLIFDSERTEEDKKKDLPPGRTQTTETQHSFFMQMALQAAAFENKRLEDEKKRKSATTH